MNYKLNKMYWLITVIISLCYFMIPMKLYADMPVNNRPKMAQEKKLGNKKTMIRSSRIIGGQDAVEGQWPWIAALVNANETNLYDAQFCGGSLVHPSWVITAAHCVEGETETSIQVAIGIHNLDNPVDELINIKRIIMHPNYDPESMDADIALIELSTPSRANPVKLFSEDTNLNGQEAIILGWGSMDVNSDTYAHILQQVTIPIVPNKTCNESYTSETGDTTIYALDTMICAGYSQGGKDSCQGDSGGPLLIKHDGVWKLAGVVSFGEGCAQPGLYGVYTKVAKFNDFLMGYFNTSRYPIWGRLTTSIAGYDSLAVKNAKIILKNTNYSSHSNENGVFYMDVPPGTYTISITAPDLKTIEHSIDITAASQIDISQQMKIQGQSIVETSSATLSQDFILNIPLIIYNDQKLWADLMFIESNTNRILFELKNYGSIK
ncbi:MAG: trypsin-like serine protease [Desulfobacterales bacterium]|nr:trypsin-like serine protease [Desulfobacterales bacterium]